MRSQAELLRQVLEQIRVRTGKEPKQSTGGWWLCRCPSHEDSEPSLGVLAGDRAIVFKCYAGCSPDAVAGALGFDLGDLFYESVRPASAGRSDQAVASDGSGGSFQDVPSDGSDQDSQSSPSPHLERSSANQDSGPLTVEALAAAKGVRAELLRELGCECANGAVHIPYFQEDGTRAPRTRIRKALAGKKGWAWTGTAEDGEIVPYGLQRLEEARSQGELIVVEGESDCWNLWEAGFAALGMPGATTCGKLEGRHVRGIARVYVSRESDKAGAAFAAALSARLREIGYEGEIRIFNCGACKDPAELRAATGTGFATAFRERLARARSPESPPSEYTAGNVADVFLREGRDTRVFRAAASDDPGEQHILFHRGAFYGYTGRAYEPISADEMDARVAQFIRSRTWLLKKEAEGPGNPSRAFVGNVRLALAAQGCVPALMNVPVWRDGRAGERVLVLENGLLDVDQVLRFLDAQDELIGARDAGEEFNPEELLAAALRPHTPDLFSLVELPFPWQGETGCPKWRAFLNRVVPLREIQTILQEWFGYCLLPTQGCQRLLIMQGEGANGKSVAMGVLKNLIGERNWSAVPLESLDRPHMLKPLEGKLVNFSTEWTHIESAAINLLKAISGGDPVHINPKNRDGYDLLLPTRFVITTNDPPRLSDRTEAIWRRLLTVPFAVTIPLRERRPLEAYVRELCEELPGILWWALVGLHRLTRQGGFSDCEATEALKAEYREDAHPEFLFCEERLLLSERGTVRADALYETYKEYCSDGGYRPMHRNRFGREVARWFRQKQPGGELARVRTAATDGSRPWAYQGIDWATYATVDSGKIF